MTIIKKILKTEKNTVTFESYPSYPLCAGKSVLCDDSITFKLLYKN